MKNKTYKTLFSIPYSVELKKLELVKSINATLLMSALEYHFEKSPEGFHKFIMPCFAQQAFNVSSWAEDLGMSREEFTGAFDQIGYRYTSKDEFLRFPDLARDKYYFSIQERQNFNRMLYRRNHRVVENAIAELITNRNS